MINNQVYETVFFKEAAQKNGEYYAEIPKIQKAQN